MADLDFSKLKIPHKNHDDCTVLDVGTGTYPRYIEVRPPGADGSRQTALWDGSLNLVVNDKVLCHEYPGNPIWRIMAVGGNDSGVGKVRVSDVWESDFGGVALQSDADGDILINTATQVTGLFGAAKLQVDRTVNGTLLLHRESADAGGITLEFLKRRSGFGVVSDGDRIVTLAFTAADGVDAAPAAYLYAQVDGTPGNNDMPGAVVVATSSDGSATPADRLKIGPREMVLNEAQATDYDVIVRTNAASNMLFIDGGGETVAVNTNVVLTDAFGVHKMAVYTTNNTGLQFGRFSADVGGPIMSFVKSRNASIASHTAVQAGDRLGTIGFSGSDGANFDNAAQIFSNCDAVTGSVYSGLLGFSTVDTGGTIREAMRIDDAQQVGIGSSAPQGRLHGYDAISGFLHWKYDGLDATSRTIIPNGTGDVLYELFGMYVLRDSTGTTASGTFSVTNGGSTGLVVGGDTVTVAVAATGAVTVSRTMGSDTIKVAFWLLWL